MRKTSDRDPMNEMSRIQHRMNELFDRALATTDFQEPNAVGSWVPVADVYETAEHLVVCLELPGLDQGGIEVRVEDDDLVVEGRRSMEREQAGGQFHRVERSYGTFSRRFGLPSSVDRESVQAVFRDGVLSVTLARREGAGPRAIRVSIR
jgi:HSP20 family protein